MKKNWKHINIEQRKLIGHLLSKKSKLKEIAELLDVDSSTVSRELKRNRTIRKHGRTSKACIKLDRYPYVCNACNLKYTTCPFTQYVYDAKLANNLANQKLILSRKGIDLTDEEYRALDKLIKDGTDRNESIYHIVNSHDEIKKSVPTIYRYINNGYLSTKRMDLPFAVSYKKRKTNKKYDYPQNNSINRNNHTYIDYLAFKRNNPNLFECQMDFLGSIKTDTKEILTLVFPDFHFVILDIIANPSSNKIIAYFDDLKSRLGPEHFKTVFSYILTDRDPNFADYNNIEFDKDTGEKLTHIFYCDPYVSNQKGSVENMNKQLRKYFPKKKSIQNVPRDYVKKTQQRINQTRIRSLDGATPEEAFIKIYGEDIFNKLIK